MQIALIIYTVITMILLGFLGLKWKSSTLTNMGIKVFLVLVTVGGLFVLVKGILILPFLAVSGMVFLAGAAVWNSDDGLNIGIKGTFALMAIFAVTMLLLRL